MRGRMMVAALTRRPIVKVSHSAQFVSSAGGSSSKVEKSMHTMLQTQLEAIYVKVTDISGGCGSMFDVEVVSPHFAGQSRVKQHRMVNQILKEEIKSMHGLTIKTMTPEQFQTK